MTSPLSNFEDLFYDLHTGVVGDHERPHKPIMLLAVIDLIEGGSISDNLIPFSDVLRQRFTHYYEIVKKENDRNTPANPYFYLRKEDFWSHVATGDNQPIVDALSSPPGIQKIRDLIAGAKLDDTLWLCLHDSKNRAALRDVLISRYFPEFRKKLIATSANATASVLKEQETTYEVSGRSSGFRKIVVQVYEHQCAACGLRIRLPGGHTVVDAAHIIPFAESQDDHPRNGIALCKNHHWAMDRSLIAPNPDLIWTVSSHLDDRQPGEKELLQLQGRSVILPKEKAYHPLPNALEWRLGRLLGN